MQKVVVITELESNTCSIQQDETNGNARKPWRLRGLFALQPWVVGVFSTFYKFPNSCKLNFQFWKLCTSIYQSRIKNYPSFMWISGRSRISHWAPTYQLTIFSQRNFGPGGGGHVPWAPNVNCSSPRFCSQVQRTSISKPRNDSRTRMKPSPFVRKCTTEEDVKQGFKENYHFTKSDCWMK